MSRLMSVSSRPSGHHPLLPSSGQLSKRLPTAVSCGQCDSQVAHHRRLPFPRGRRRGSNCPSATMASSSVSPFACNNWAVSTLGGISSTSSESIHAGKCSGCNSEVVAIFNKAMSPCPQLLSNPNQPLEPCDKSYLDSPWFATADNNSLPGGLGAVLCYLSQLTRSLPMGTYGFAACASRRVLSAA